MHDTFSGLVKPAVLGGLGFALAFAGYVIWLGWDEAMAEFQIWWISALGSLGAVMLLFLWNLACAPYRIERDAHNLTRAERDSLRVKAGISGRHLTPSQKQRLADTVRERLRADHSILILSFSNEECLDLSSDLAEAFRMAGSTATSIHTTLLNGPINPSFRDLELVEWVDSDHQLVLDISQRLSECGLRHKIRKEN